MDASASADSLSPSVIATAIELAGSFSYDGWPDAPDWVRWRCYQPDGSRIYSELEPILGRECWQNQRHSNGEWGRYQRRGDHTVQDWRHTKIKRFHETVPDGKSVHEVARERMLKFLGYSGRESWECLHDAVRSIAHHYPMSSFNSQETAVR